MQPVPPDGRESRALHTRLVSFKHARGCSAASSEEEMLPWPLSHSGTPMQPSIGVRFIQWMMLLALALAVVPSTPASAQTATAPTYTNSPASNGLGMNGGEPSIGVNWHSARVFVQANIQTLRVTFNDAVSPATATWEDKSAAL